jgi:hypothetical protein
MSKYGAVLFVFAAGLIHLAIVPDHLSHAPVHGLTFLAIGTTQVLWAIAYVRFWRLTILYWAGLGLSGGIVLLWVLTQLIMPPFAAEPEAIDVATIVSKCAEIAGFLSLLIFARQHQGFRSSRHILATSVAITLAAGIVMFFGGHAADLLMPQLAHAHSSDTATTHSHEDTRHHDPQTGNHAAKGLEVPAHSGSDHAHDQAAEASTGQAGSRLSDLPDSPASASQTGLLVTPNHQHSAGGSNTAHEAPPTEQETSHLSDEHHHHEAGADHSIAKSATAGPENQSVAAGELGVPITSDHAQSNEDTISEDHHSDDKIITGLEAGGNPAVQTDASEGIESIIEEKSDETTQSTASSEMVDQNQDQTAAEDSFGPDPAFGTGPSWQQMPQYQPGWGHREPGYPSIQNSPDQLQMFRNRWHSSAWSPQGSMNQSRPGW